ncbi:MAG: right-handed parallel beta-helix repeat-containing protein, partial [Planctomycetes bacterium]|nr:right-handed parallel beta-helix repeat-containing protein [Planctomycetota bacterium]
VTRVTFDQNTIGVQLLGGGNSVTSSTFTRNGVGMLVQAGDNQVLGNVVTGSTTAGVQIIGATASRNVLYGNTIGQSSGVGVLVVGANGNVIGGDAAGQANDVRNNAQQGIVIQSGRDNSISSNVYAANGPAIDSTFSPANDVVLSPGANEGILPADVLSITDVADGFFIQMFVQPYAGQSGPFLARIQVYQQGTDKVMRPLTPAPRAAGDPYPAGVYMLTPGQVNNVWVRLQAADADLQTAITLTDFATNPVVEDPAGPDSPVDPGVLGNTNAFSALATPTPGNVVVNTADYDTDPDDDPDQTMFRLVKGEVTFEGIHFKLKPNRPKNEQTVAAVGIVNGRACTFRNCVFTLAEEDDSRVAAVHLPNAEKATAMMDPATRGRPTVTFDRCLIRGRGRGVWVAASRPLGLTMTDTLTAIDGPVLLAEAGGKAAGSAMSEAKFARVTVLAGGAVVEMRGGKTADAMRAAGLVPLRVDADECLFVAVPLAGKPLLELDGVDPTEWKSVLTWHVTHANRYANFESGAVLASIRPGGEGVQKDWLRDDWIANVGEAAGADKRFGQVTFANPAKGREDLPALKPADLVAKMTDFPDPVGPNGLEVGAEPSKLQELPPVGDEPKPE